MEDYVAKRVRLYHTNSKAVDKSRVRKLGAGGGFGQERTRLALSRRALCLHIYGTLNNPPPPVFAAPCMHCLAAGGSGGSASFGSLYRIGLGGRGKLRAAALASKTLCMLLLLSCCCCCCSCPALRCR